jgi:hypothetical protein
MPAKPSWFTRIPEIIAEVHQLNAPVIDRHICELLFGVRRRRAIELMQRFGGYRTGNTVVLDRTDLIRSLERLQGSPDAACERRRKHRLAERLDELHRLRSAAVVTLPVSVHAGAPRHRKLPEGVSFDGQRHNHQQHPRFYIGKSLRNLRALRKVVFRPTAACSKPNASRPTAFSPKRRSGNSTVRTEPVNNALRHSVSRIPPCSLSGGVF